MKSAFVCLLAILAGIVLNPDVEAAPRALVVGCLQVYCLLNPCMFHQCPPGTHCSANYCGGCNAECLNGDPVDVLHTVG